MHPWNKLGSAPCGLTEARQAAITTIIETARRRVQTVVDQEMIRAYREIGWEIVEDEQLGEKRAEY